MLIVGELINTSRIPIKAAVDNRDEDYIKEIARRQAEAGATYLDINCGTLLDKELEVMEWLIKLVKEVVDLPLCVDSPNPKALKVGLELADNGQPMINSITAEKERFDAVLELVLKYKAKVVALCMDDSGIPDSVESRIKIVRTLVDGLKKAGVPEDDIYIDPLVKPLSTSDNAGLEVIDTVRFIRQEYPLVHTICGLNNVGYGLPNRRVLNQVFMIQTMTAGMDAYILDPLDKKLMGFIYASQALLGKDPFCCEYLKVHRSGMYTS